MRLRSVHVGHTLSISEICDQFVTESINKAVERAGDSGEPAVVDDVPVVVKVGNSYHSVVGLELVQITKSGKTVFVLQSKAD